MHELTHRQKRFALFVVLIISLTLGVVIYFVRLHAGASGGKLVEGTISFLYGLLASLIIGLGTFGIKPVQDWFQSFLARPDGDGKQIRILLFGQTGSGKTSLALHALTAKPLEPLDSTSDFVVRPGTVLLDSEKSLSVQFGDYRGEEPSQVTTQIPSSFAGVEATE